MRHLALLTAALAFGLGTTAALAEDAPGAKSDITIVESTPNADSAASNSGAMNEPSDTSDPLAKHNRDYETTRSLLNVSMDCYRMQMSAISGVGSAGWHYQYR